MINYIIGNPINNKALKKFHISSLTKLPVLANGESALSSNASNFHGAMNSTVDSRTGNASFSMAVASVLYNQGQARRDLSLSYTGGPSALGFNSLDLGPHWAFNIGVEHPSISEVYGHKTTDIITGDGHNFTMVSDRYKGKNFWHPLRHKLKDVKITGKPGNWTIATSAGTREHLLNGYEDWEENLAGQRIWFYYNKNNPWDITRHLIYICGHPLTTNQIHGYTNACLNNGVRLSYQTNKITIHGRRVLTLHIFNVKGAPMVKYVTMPPLSSKGISNSDQLATIKFDYDSQGNYPWLLRKVTEPSGEENVFLYNQESSRATLHPHGLSTGFSNGTIPVVTEQLTLPPFNERNIIPVKHIWYQYSNNNKDQHNYTGYQAGINAVPGKDNLLDQADNYTYTVAQDNGLTTTHVVYNKYHLPLTITQQNDATRTTVARNDTTYNQWRNTTFLQLSPTYSLPKQNNKTLYLLTSKKYKYVTHSVKVIEKKQYNNYGQTIWQQDTYGRQTFTQYCPVHGDKHCPAVNYNWPQLTMPEKVLQLPAKHSSTASILYQAFTNTNATPAVEVVYDYTRIPIAQPYKNKLNNYKRLLQQKIKSSHRTTLIQNQTFKDTVGIDTLSQAGILQVKTKTIGTIPAVMLSNLKLGQTLPELTLQQTNTKTEYKYNLKQNSFAYGQLTKIKMTRPTNTITNHWIHGRLLKLITLPAPTQQSITMSINHLLNRDRHTVTTTISIVPNALQPNIYNKITQFKTSKQQKFKSNNYPSLGTEVFSLVNGARLSSEDTMKSLHTFWTYDIWQRPIKKVTMSTHDGHSQTISWCYINTSKENAVIKTNANKNQSKVVYSGQSGNKKIISTWHRFKPDTKASMEGKSNWIIDSKITYTKTGNIASKTVYHAADHKSNIPAKTIALTTIYGYDALNRLIWTKTPDGIITFTVRNDPAMWLMGYSIATGNLYSVKRQLTEAKKEKLAPVLTLVQSNTLGKPVAQYTFTFNPMFKTNGKNVYSSLLQQQLKNLEQKLKPLSYLKSTGSYGLLPLEGQKGLIAFVQSAINAKAWLTKTTTMYDGNGKRIAQIQPNGSTTHWEWENGNLIATIAPDGSMIHDTFNIMGKKTSRCVQPANGDVCHILGERKYDNEGNLAWQTDEHGNRISYTYDADGRLLTMTIPPAKLDSKGHILSYTYNDYGKTEESIDGTPYVKYTWDPLTLRLTDKDDNISHLHYGYDTASGQLLTISRSAPVTFKSPVGINYPTGVETIKYDRYNSPIQMTDFAGNTFINCHDNLGRIIKNLVILPKKHDTVVLTTTTYDDYFNRTVNIKNGIGIIRDFTYNSLGQLESSTDQQKNGILQTLSYKYDLQTNNIISFIRTENNTSATQTYTYDKKSNDLITMTCNTTGRTNIPNLLCPRETDLTDNLEITPPLILSQQYSFDKWHNISSITEKLSTVDGKQITKKVDYGYAFPSNKILNNNKIHQRYDPHQMITIRRAWQNSNIDYRPHTITYDKLGRVIKDAQGNVLHYNDFGQQDEFTNIKTHQHTIYTYNSAGHQIAEQSFSAKNKPLQPVLYMLYQGNNIASQVQGDNHHNTNISTELGGVAHSENGVINRWYLHDYKGDVLDTFNSDGYKTRDNVYSPYGMSYNLLALTSQALPAKLKITTQSQWWQSHEPGFDNQMDDPATGYQFLGGGYRAYNPIYRHFMSHDSYSPFKIIDGYGFAGNNPIMNTDPTGHIPQWLSYSLAGAGIIMAIASAFLLPVIASAAFPATSIMASITPVSVALGGIGAASGTLQITGIAIPHNHNLSIANTAFGVANGISAIAMGTITTSIGVISAIQGISKLTSSLIITSGTSTALSSVIGSGESGMDISAMVDPGLTKKAGWNQALNVLAYSSIALMAISVASGIGANFSFNNSTKTLPASATSNCATSNIEESSSLPSSVLSFEPITSPIVDPVKVIELENMSVYEAKNLELGVFGCGTNPCTNGRCIHLYANTFDFEEKIEPTFISDLTEGAPAEAEPNSYDAILQEFAPGDFFNAAETLLKPGGRLYIMEGGLLSSRSYIDKSNGLNLYSMQWYIEKASHFNNMQYNGSSLTDEFTYTHNYKVYNNFGGARGSTDMLVFTKIRM